MRHATYLIVLAVCLLSALWLEPVLRVGVFARWRRLLFTIVPVVVVFAAWDVAAIAAGHWWFDLGQIVGVMLPGGLPIEESLFFVVVPLCAILGFEAVTRVTASRVAASGSARGGRRPSGEDEGHPEVEGEVRR